MSSPCLHLQVLGSLLPDTLMDYLQNSQLKTRTQDYGSLAGPSQVPVKVGMLSKRALDILYVIHTYKRCRCYRLTRRASSPTPAIHNLGSKPPDTPLLEYAPVPFDSVRILLANPSADLSRPCSLDWVRRLYLEPAYLTCFSHFEPADYPTCFSHLESSACRIDVLLFLLTESRRLASPR